MNLEQKKPFIHTQGNKSSVGREGSYILVTKDSKPKACSSAAEGWKDGMHEMALLSRDQGHMVGRWQD